MSLREEEEFEVKEDFIGIDWEEVIDCFFSVQEQQEILSEHICFEEWTFRQVNHMTT